MRRQGQGTGRQQQTRRRPSGSFREAWFSSRQPPERSQAPEWIRAGFAVRLGRPIGRPCRVEVAATSAVGRVSRRRLTVWSACLLLLLLGPAGLLLARRAPPDTRCQVCRCAAGHPVELCAESRPAGQRGALLCAGAWLCVPRSRSVGCRSTWRAGAERSLSSSASSVPTRTPDARRKRKAGGQGQLPPRRRRAELHQPADLRRAALPRALARIDMPVRGDHGGRSNTSSTSRLARTWRHRARLQRRSGTHHQRRRRPARPHRARGAARQATRQLPADRRQTRPVDEPLRAPSRVLRLRLRRRPPRSHAARS